MKGPDSTYVVGATWVGSGDVESGPPTMNRRLVVAAVLI
jgi:hypothetical protein